MSKLIKILIGALTFLGFLIFIDYAIFDFIGVKFCDYKSIVDEKVELSKSYDLVEVAKLAERNNLIDRRYTTNGYQVVLVDHHFGAQYTALLRYSTDGFSKIYIDHFNLEGGAACYTPVLLIRFFAWKMFYNSGLETGWLGRVWIHPVMYWPFYIGFITINNIIKI